MDPTPVILSCDGTCTVTHVITMDPAQHELTAERVADYQSLFAMFLLAGVLILGAKALYKRFRIDYDH